MKSILSSDIKKQYWKGGFFRTIFFQRPLELWMFGNTSKRTIRERIKRGFFFMIRGTKVDFKHIFSLPNRATYIKFLEYFIKYYQRQKKNIRILRKIFEGPSEAQIWILIIIIFGGPATEAQMSIFGTNF